MSLYPPLPERHRVKNPLFIEGRAYATCSCHWQVQLTQTGELPRNAHLRSVS